MTLRNLIILAAIVLYIMPFQSQAAYAYRISVGCYTGEQATPGALASAFQSSCSAVGPITVSCDKNNCTWTWGGNMAGAGSGSAGVQLVGTQDICTYPQIADTATGTCVNPTCPAGQYYDYDASACTPTPLPTPSPTSTPTPIPTPTPAPIPPCSGLSCPVDAGKQCTTGFTVSNFSCPNPTPTPTGSPLPTPTPTPEPKPCNQLLCAEPGTMCINGEGVETPYKGPSCNPFPTPNPSPIPTGNPTPNPTPGPTGNPSPVPTGDPSPNPTPGPTGNPSPVPTGNPNPNPVPGGDLYPCYTGYACNPPNPAATPVPAPPWPSCPPGTFAGPDNLCITSDCPAGTYDVSPIEPGPQCGLLYPMPTPNPSPLPTPNPSPDPTPSPTPDPTPSPTPNPSPLPLPSPVPNATATAPGNGKQDGYGSTVNLMSGLCDGDCTTVPSCKKGTCSVSERLNDIKNKYSVTPTASGDCPAFDIDLSAQRWGSHHVTAHCGLIESVRGPIHTIMTILIALGVITIILGA